MAETIHINQLRGRIDFAVIAIRHDEYAAVIRRFPHTSAVIGGRQGYRYCRAVRRDGKSVRIAFIRSSSQGHSPAQVAASKAIADLDPKWLVLVGIAGGVPSNEFSLGDVLLADSFLDFSVTAAKQDKVPELRTRGGPIHRDLEPILADLRGWESELGNWNAATAIIVPKPQFEVPNDITSECYYGPNSHRESVRDALLHNFPDLQNLRPPIVDTGALATSNELVKDTDKLAQWLSVGRHITHIEMEYGGVEWAARTFSEDRHIPLLSIRGISDLVGFDRIPQCTAYACNTAASFFHALVMEGPLEHFKLDDDDSEFRTANTGRGLIAASLTALWAGISTVFSAAIGYVLGRQRSEVGETPTTEDIATAFRKSSSALLNKVVKPDDRIPRAELSAIDETLATSDDCPLIFVLGGPGSGKTALLALFANNAIANGQITLAIKADTFPSDQSFDEWGKSVLELDLSLIDAVRAVATQSNVLVVIDQLDALSSTVDLTSDRLNALVSFIEDCLSVPGVSVVCSCRSFDYSHDARFSSLNARVVELALPQWDDVSTFLKNHGVPNPDGWPSDFKELLRNPQHLTIYLNRFENTGKSDPFKSYQLMLDDLWERLVTTKEERDVLYSLTGYLIEHEELWAPLVKFEDHRNVLQSLEAKGILVAQDLRIGFRHQTLLEHAKARLFTKDDKSLCTHVVERQNAVLVRPTVWAVLQYLREANPAKYRQELEELFNATLRLHIRYLLMEFLGRQTDPRDFEVELIGKCLSSNDDRVRALISIRGQREYFNELSMTHLPTIMRGPVDAQWLLIGVLSDAWSFDRDRVLTLIEDNWLNDPSKDELTHRVMSGLSAWDERSVNIVRTLIRRTKDSGDRIFWAESLVFNIAESQPKLAPALFVDIMRQLETNNRE